MKKWYQDKEYIEIVNDIINNHEFKKLNDYKHHSGKRFNHCIRVSYYSYLLSKKLKLDYKASARAGVLHDFFLVNNQSIAIKERINVLVNHPLLALENSKKYFTLSDLEQDIIKSHMFPINIFMIPKHRESWLVNFIDDLCSIYERAFVLKNSFIKGVKNIALKTPLRRIVKAYN